MIHVLQEVEFLSVDVNFHACIWIVSLVKGSFNFYQAVFGLFLRFWKMLWLDTLMRGGEALPNIMQWRVASGFDHPILGINGMKKQLSSEVFLHAQSSFLKIFALFNMVTCLCIIITITMYYSFITVEFVCLYAIHKTLLIILDGYIWRTF